MKVYCGVSHDYNEMYTSHQDKTFRCDECGAKTTFLAVQLATPKQHRSDDPLVKSLLGFRNVELYAVLCAPGYVNVYEGRNNAKH